MNCYLKVLAPIYPISFYCPNCGKPVVQGDAVIRLVLLDLDPDADAEENTVQLLRAERPISCCGTILTVPEIFPTVREALEMIDTIERSLGEGDDPFIQACTAHLYAPTALVK